MNYLIFRQNNYEFYGSNTSQVGTGATKGHKLNKQLKEIFATNKELDLNVIKRINLEVKMGRSSVVWKKCLKIVNISE